MNQGRTMLAMWMTVGLICLVGISLVPDAAAEPLQDPNKPVVVFETSKGAITVELDREKAPLTVENFLKYVDAGHYDGTVYHRVIPGFMIQGGGMTADMKEKRTGGGIRNEGGNGLRNARGTLAMARTSDPNSATAQFFINLKDNRFLDRDQAQDGVGYAVFGKVIAGMEVVDAIAGVKTGRKGMHDDVPVEAIEIKSAKRQ
jgi:cyclophilin family peptidyl-prolyl cis-trans isomerase